MPHVAHFAINANDVDRAKRFYERVFGWKFNAWGPPGFDTARAVIANGGTTVLEKSVMVGVGALAFFQDPGGNVFGAIQFDRNAE